MRTSLTPASGTPNYPGGMILLPGAWVQATMINAAIGSSVAPVLSVPESQGFALLKTGLLQGVGWFSGTAGAATNTTRLALYDNDPATNKPRNSIRELGTYTNGAGTGSKAITFSSMTLNPGIYWIVFVVQGSGTLPNFQNGNGASPFVPNDGSNFNSDYARYTHPAVASGSLPSPMSAPDAVATNGRRFFLLSPNS